jgi:HEAT repeat protein
MASHAAYDPQSVQVNIDRLNSPDATVRLQAAAGLGAMGRKAVAAVTALAGALQDSDAEVRRAVAVALG